MIQKLESKCKNEGCNEKGTMKYIFKHLKQCSYRKIPEWLSTQKNYITIPEKVPIQPIEIIDDDNHQSSQSNYCRNTRQNLPLFPMPYTGKMTLFDLH